MIVYTLLDVCFERHHLMGLFVAVPVTGTLIIKVLRLTVLLTVAESAALSPMCCG